MSAAGCKPSTRAVNDDYGMLWTHYTELQKLQQSNSCHFSSSRSTACHQPATAIPTWEFDTSALDRYIASCKSDLITLLPDDRHTTDHSFDDYLQQAIPSGWPMQPDLDAMMCTESARTFSLAPFLASESSRKHGAGFDLLLSGSPEPEIEVADIELPSYLAQDASQHHPLQHAAVQQHAKQSDSHKDDTAALQVLDSEFGCQQLRPQQQHPLLVSQQQQQQQRMTAVDVVQVLAGMQLDSDDGNMTILQVDMDAGADDQLATAGTVAQLQSILLDLVQAGISSSMPPAGHGVDGSALDDDDQNGGTQNDGDMVDMVGLVIDWGDETRPEDGCDAEDDAQHQAAAQPAVDNEQHSPQHRRQSDDAFSSEPAAPKATIAAPELIGEPKLTHEVTSQKPAVLPPTAPKFAKRKHKYQLLSANLAAAAASAEQAEQQRRQQPGQGNSNDHVDDDDNDDDILAEEDQAAGLKLTTSAAKANSSSELCPPVFPPTRKGRVPQLGRTKLSSLVLTKPSAAATGAATATSAECTVTAISNGPAVPAGVADDDVIEDLMSDSDEGAAKPIAEPISACHDNHDGLTRNKTIMRLLLGVCCCIEHMENNWQHASKCKY